MHKICWKGIVLVIDNYWTRLSEISRIIELPKPQAETDNAKPKPNSIIILLFKKRLHHAKTS